MTWNPFNWTAEPFLALYVALAAIVFLLGFGFRSVIGPAASAARQLSVLELAYLAGGARRFGDAVLLSLTSGNGATIDSKDYKITVTSQAPLAILCGRPTALQFAPGITRQKFQKAVKPLAEQVLGRLQTAWLLPDRRSDVGFPDELSAPLSHCCWCSGSPRLSSAQNDIMRSGFWSVSSSSQLSSASCWRRVRCGRGRQRRLSGLSGLEGAGGAGAARARASACRGALGHGRPLGHRLRVGPFRFADHGQQW